MRLSLITNRTRLIALPSGVWFFMMNITVMHCVDRFHAILYSGKVPLLCGKCPFINMHVYIQRCRCPADSKTCMDKISIVTRSYCMVTSQRATLNRRDFFIGLGGPQPHLLVSKLGPQIMFSHVRFALKSSLELAALQRVST